MIAGRLLRKILLLVFLTGCASTEISDDPPVSPQPAASSVRPRVGEIVKPAPVVAKAPTPPPKAPIPVPKVPVEVPKVSASPYLFVAPHIGRWQYVIDPARGLPDPNFTLVLNAKHEVEYGPNFVGTYRLIDDNKTIELLLVGRGDFAGRRPGPILFRLEFYEGGTVMVFRQGDNSMVLKRVP